MVPVYIDIGISRHKGASECIRWFTNMVAVVADDDEKIQSELHSAREGENNKVRGRKKKAVALGGGRTLDRMKFQFYEL